jgi:hypothetical protein
LKQNLLKWLGESAEQLNGKSKQKQCKRNQDLEEDTTAKGRGIASWTRAGVLAEIRMHSPGRRQARGEHRPEVEERAATSLLDRWTSGRRPAPDGGGYVGSRLLCSDLVICACAHFVYVSKTGSIAGRLKPLGCDGLPPRPTSKVKACYIFHALGHDPCSLGPSYAFACMHAADQ